MDDNELLVKTLLSEFFVEDQLPDETDDRIDEDEDVKISSTPYDWDDLSDAEEVNFGTCATEEVPSYIDTMDGDRDVVAEFEREFPKDTKFTDKEEARTLVKDFAKEMNIPFNTDKSDSVHIKLVCIHYGEYRASKKKPDNTNAGKWYTWYIR